MDEPVHLNNLACTTIILKITRKSAPCYLAAFRVRKGITGITTTCNDRRNIKSKLRQLHNTHSDWQEYILMLSRNRKDNSWLTDSAVDDFFRSSPSRQNSFADVVFNHCKDIKFAASEIRRSQGISRIRRSPIGQSKVRRLEVREVVKADEDRC